MALQTSGQITHTDIMAEFNEPAGAWRLSQDGGLLLQSVGDPKGPSDMIKETDFYNISASSPAPTGTFVLRPTLLQWNYSGIFRSYLGSTDSPAGWDNLLPNGADGNPATSAPGANNIDPDPLGEYGNFNYSQHNIVRFGGIQLQQQVGVGAWDNSWVMSNFEFHLDLFNSGPTGDQGLVNSTFGTMDQDWYWKDALGSAGGNHGWYALSGAPGSITPNFPWSPEDGSDNWFRKSLGHPTQNFGGGNPNNTTGFLRSFQRTAWKDLAFTGFYGLGHQFPGSSLPLQVSSKTMGKTNGVPQRLFSVQEAAVERLDASIYFGALQFRNAGVSGGTRSIRMFDFAAIVEFA